MRTKHRNHTNHRSKKYFMQLWSSLLKLFFIEFISSSLDRFHRKVLQVHTTIKLQLLVGNTKITSLKYSHGSGITLMISRVAHDCIWAVKLELVFDEVEGSTFPVTYQWTANWNYTSDLVIRSSEHPNQKYHIFIYHPL